jgi:8-oxo-dGTP diphosphatase
MTFDHSRFRHPDAVLIYPFFDGQLLFTHHRQRGLELPGGKIEKDEWPIHAAIRELFEETGAEAESLEAIAQYKIIEAGWSISLKQVFIARIARLHTPPKGYETDRNCLFHIPPSFQEVISDTRYSEHMRDQVYPLSLDFIMQNKQSFLT